MKQFKTMVINKKEVKGEGCYERVTRDLLIEAIDHTIRIELVKAIKEKIIIESIEFKGGESDGIFGGKYLVSDIKGDFAKLKKI